MDEALLKEIKKLKNLRQNGDKTDQELKKSAIFNLKKKDLDLKSRFETQKEKDEADKLFKQYLTHYEFDNFSDLNTLADLIYEEILKRRIQNTLNKAKKSNGEYVFVNDKAAGALHDVEDRVNHLKVLLGINKTRDESELTALQKLKKRFKTYINFAKHEFSVSCKHCGGMLLMRRRVDNFKVLKHPYFSGRFLYNLAVFEDLKKKKINKKQAAKYCFTTTHYITWALKNEKEILECAGVTKEDLENFLAQNPYLPNK